MIEGRGGGSLLQILDTSLCYRLQTTVPRSDTDYTLQTRVPVADTGYFPILLTTDNIILLYTTDCILQTTISLSDTGYFFILQTADYKLQFLCQIRVTSLHYRQQTSVYKKVI